MSVFEEAKRRVLEAYKEKARDEYESGLDRGDDDGEANFLVYRKFRAEGYDSPEEYLRMDPYMAGCLGEDFDSDDCVSSFNEKEVNNCAKVLAEFVKDETLAESSSCGLGTDGKGADALCYEEFIGAKEKEKGIEVHRDGFSNIKFTRKQKKLKKAEAKEESEKN